ncbi:hypothetical protein JCM10450v2_002944 [Rhodotorula kratochvilovae]
MPDTDYDSLPSPPKARARTRPGAGSAAGGRLYGRKAARRVVGVGSAHGGAEVASSSSDEGEDARVGEQGRRAGKEKGGAKGGAKGAGKKRAVARRKEREEEGDVESNDDGDPEDAEVLLPLTGRSSKRATGKASASSVKTASSPKRGRKVVAHASVESDGEHVLASSTAPGPSRRIRALHAVSSATTHPAGNEARGPLSRKSSNAMQGDVPPLMAAKAVKARDPTSVSRLSPAVEQIRAVSPPLSPRARALVDKSNLTADSPRRTAMQGRPSQSALSTLAPRPSVSRESSPGLGSLSVFRDLPASALQGAGGLSSRPAPLPLPSLSASTRLSAHPRIPRAASPYRLASEPPPSRPSPAHRALSRSPSATAHALPRRSISLHTSPRAPHRTSPALLAVPGTSRDSLAPSSLPAPWALAAPASARLEASSSPAAAEEGGDAPVFRYTTTEFGHAPSLRLSLDGGASEREVRTGAAEEDDGPGMESSIVLETWEDELSRVAGGEREVTPIAEDAGDGDETVMPAKPGIEVDPLHDGAMDVDGVAPIQPQPLKVDLAEIGGAAELNGEPAAMDEAGDETIKGVAPVRTQDNVEHSATPELPDAEAAEHPVEEIIELDEVLAAEPRSPKAFSAAVSPPPPAFFTASSMPPRRARPSVDDPLPTDDLAYYLRTTGTYSSEDDLPSSAPSDTSEREDYLAEREIGRGVKPSSRQREKRLAASAEAKRLRLAAGRREGREREVLDVGEVKLSRVVRHAIERRAMGVTAAEEEEIRAALRKQKAGWRTGLRRMLPSSTDEILRGGDSGNSEASADSSETSGGAPKWVFAVVVVVIVLLVGGAVTGYGLWRRRRARAFQRLGGDDETAPPGGRSSAAPAYPPSTVVFVDTPSSRSAAAHELRLLPSIPYAGAVESASPGYSPTVPHGHGSALLSSPSSAVSLHAPSSPSPHRTPSRRAPPGLTLEPQSLISSLAADEERDEGALRSPTRAPSLPPPPYSPRVVGVGVCLSPRRAEGAV